MKRAIFLERVPDKQKVGIAWRCCHTEIEKSAYRGNKNVLLGRQRPVAKASREAYETHELFEARKPKDPATVSEIDGVVRFGDIKRGKREIFVRPTTMRNGQAVPDDQSEEHTYEVGAGKHLRVHEGDRVRAGDRLSEGPVNPHDILRNILPKAGALPKGFSLEDEE